MYFLDARSASLRGSTGVLCQSYGLLIGMYYVLSRGLRHQPVLFHPYGVLLEWLSPVGAAYHRQGCEPLRKRNRRIHIEPRRGGIIINLCESVPSVVVFFTKITVNVPLIYLWVICGNLCLK